MGRIIAMTGTTGGLGTIIAEKLVEKGYSLVFIDRNRNKSAKNAERIRAKFNDASITLLTCDLESFESVKHMANTLKKIKVDTLLLGSGIYSAPLKKCSTGYNNVFQVNFVSQYFLARYLSETCPTLKHVVAIGSVAHNYSKIDEKDIDFSEREQTSKIYGNSKRFLMFSLYEYFKNEKWIDLSIAHPGVTYTNMTGHYPKAINWLVKIGIKLFFPSPRKAVRSIIRAVDDKCGYMEWIGPSILGVWGKPKKSVLKTCSKEESEAIGRLSDDIYKNQLTFDN